MKIGDHLPNGAVLLAFRETDDGTTVLAMCGGTQPFATWRYHATPTPLCWAGHYFFDLESALADFRSR